MNYTIIKKYNRESTKGAPMKEFFFNRKKGLRLSLYLTKTSARDDDHPAADLWLWHRNF